jgi:hypothetical protein
MGMDVYGNKPSSKVGEYFRRNVWGWRPLADYALEVAPNVAGKCQYWHSNDGRGLGKTDSLALAKELRAALADGRAAKYVADRDVQIAAIPREPCQYCGGTGVRSDEVGKSNGFDKKNDSRRTTGWTGRMV